MVVRKYTTSETEMGFLRVCFYAYSTPLRLPSIRPEKMGSGKGFNAQERFVFPARSERQCYKSAPPNISLLKFSYIQKSWKNFYSKHPCTYHLNSTIIILLYLLVRVFFMYHWSAWDNKHIIYNFRGKIPDITKSALIFKV